MSISSILKFRMENDRNAAIALDRAVSGVRQSGANTLGMFDLVSRGLRGTVHAFSINMLMYAQNYQPKTPGSLKAYLKYTREKMSSPT